MPTDTAPLTLDQHGAYWRDMAASERRIGNERLAASYEQFAATAERYCELATGQRCPSAEVVR